MRRRLLALRAGRPRRAAASRCTPTSSTSLPASIARIHSSVGSSFDERARADAAGHDEDVGARHLVERVVGDERRACPARCAPGRARRRRTHLARRAAAATPRRARSRRARSAGRTTSMAMSMTFSCRFSSAREGRKRSRYSDGLVPTRRGERAPGRLGGAEAGRARDLVDGEVGRLQQAARDLDAHPLDVRRGRAARPRRGTPARSGAGSSRRAPASRSTLWSPSGCSAIQCWRSRIGSRSASCAPSCALNCDCPPGRCTNSTSWRAVISATSRPRSSSTSASARSIPAVTPADVHTLPSRTKIGSGSTVTLGYRRAKSSHHAQCVVARRPSSSPAAASTNAPVHTDVTRRLRRASRRTPGNELGVVGTLLERPRRRPPRACRSRPRTDGERAVGDDRRARGWSRRRRAPGPRPRPGTRRPRARCGVRPRPRR